MKHDNSSYTADANALRALIADEDGYIHYQGDRFDAGFHADTDDCGWYGRCWFCHNDGVPRLVIQDETGEVEAHLAPRHVERAIALGFTMRVFCGGGL